jgi:hypothetical protein
MGGSAKVDKPDPLPSAQAQYKSWLKDYPELQPLLVGAAGADLQGLAGLVQGSGSQALEAAIGAGGGLQDAWGRAAEGDTAAAMRQLLADQIYGELAAGSALSADQAREFEQYVRAGQQARGVTGGNAAIFEEAATKGSAGIALADQRKAAAQGFLAFNAASRPNAVNALLGLADNAYTGNAEIMGGAVQQNMQNAAQNQQVQYNAAQAQAQAQAQRNQGIGGMLGSLGGAAIGFGLGGPMGAVIGGGLGNSVGGGLGGMF